MYLCCFFLKNLNLHIFSMLPGALRMNESFNRCINDIPFLQFLFCRKSVIAAFHRKRWRYCIFFESNLRFWLAKTSILVSCSYVGIDVYTNFMTLLLQSGVLYYSNGAIFLKLKSVFCRQIFSNFMQFLLGST